VGGGGGAGVGVGGACVSKLSIIECPSVFSDVYTI
jgi:hypothetical protein